MSHIDSGTSNRFRIRNQEQRATSLKGLSRKSVDELRFLVVEFSRAAQYVHFSAAEWKALDRARARLRKLEGEAA